LVALLLVASLTGKFLVGYGHGASDDQRLAAELRLRLSAQGFMTSVEPSITGLIVHATRGSCRLTARDGDNWSALSLLFQQRAKPYGSLRYVYRGTAGATPPRMRLLVDRATYRILHAFGSPILRPALLALAVTPACDTGALGRMFDGVAVARSAV
jgi:hypothetical protein